MSTSLRLLFLSALSTSILAACGGGSSGISLPPGPAPAASGSGSAPAPAPSPSTPEPSPAAPPPTPAASTPATVPSLQTCPQKNIPNATAIDLSCIVGYSYKGQTMIWKNSTWEPVTNSACTFSISAQGLNITLNGIAQGNVKLWPANYKWDAAAQAFVLEYSTDTAVVGVLALNSVRPIVTTKGNQIYACYSS